VNAATSVDFPRLIRIVTLFSAILGGALVYFTFEPDIDGLSLRLADTDSELRSDDVAFSEITRLKAERVELFDRYAQLFTQNPQAIFLRELTANVRRHAVTLVSTSVADDRSIPRDRNIQLPAFRETHLTVEIEGRYRDLLAAIADMSASSQLVEVGEANMNRDGKLVIASVPIVLFEPVTRAASSGTGVDQ